MVIPIIVLLLCLFLVVMVSAEPLWRSRREDAEDREAAGLPRWHPNPAEDQADREEAAYWTGYDVGYNDCQAGQAKRQTVLHERGI